MLICIIIDGPLNWTVTRLWNGIISMPTVMLAVFTAKIISLLALEISRNTNNCVLSRVTKWFCGSRSRVIFINHCQCCTWHMCIQIQIQMIIYHLGGFDVKYCYRMTNSEIFLIFTFFVFIFYIYILCVIDWAANICRLILNKLVLEPASQDVWQFNIRSKCDFPWIGCIVAYWLRYMCVLI